MTVLLSGGDSKREFVVKNGRELGKLSQKINHPVFKHILSHALGNFDKCHDLTLEMTQAKLDLKHRLITIKHPRGIIKKIKRFFKNHIQSLKGEFNNSELANIKNKQSSAIEELRSTLLVGSMVHGLSS
ncbi:MAG: hypothetical protein AAF443_06685 [Chlamydiota bacterium]